LKAGDLDGTRERIGVGAFMPGKRGRGEGKKCSMEQGSKEHPKYPY
jgi:hypothetical protein